MFFFYVFLVFFTSFSVFAKSEYEKMVEKAAAMQFLEEKNEESSHADAKYDTESCKREHAEDINPSDRSTYSHEREYIDYVKRGALVKFAQEASSRDQADHQYTRVEEGSMGSDSSYKEYTFFDSTTRERRHRREEKLYTICAIEPSVGSESKEPIIVRTEVTRWMEISLGPIAREAVTCHSSQDKVVETMPQMLCVKETVQRTSAQHIPEKFHHDNNPGDDDPYNRSSDSYDVGDSHPSLRQHYSPDEFTKPWTRSGKAKVMQRYQAMSALDFENLFMHHTLPLDQRNAAYYNSLPNQQYIFSQVELYQYKAFRTFLSRFPNCQQLVKTALDQLQPYLSLRQRVEKSGVYTGADPVHTATTVIRTFLSELQETREQEQREALCVNMVLAQRNQRTQLEQLVVASDTGVSTIGVRRKEALQKSLDEDFLLHKKIPIVSESVKSVLQEYGLGHTLYMLEIATPIQNCLQVELLEICQRISDKKSDNKSTRELYTTVFKTVDIANSFTVNGSLLQAMSWTDVAWSILTFAQHCLDKTYIQQRCTDARSMGNYWSTKAEWSAAHHEYLHAAVQSLATAFCYTFATFDYVLAADQGVERGIKNTCNLIIDSGKALINLDARSVGIACTALLGKCGTVCLRILDWEEAKWHLRTGNEAAAREKLRIIADEFSGVRSYVEQNMTKLKHASGHDIVRKSCELATEGVLLSTIFEFVHGLFIAAEIEAIGIAAASSAEAALALSEQSVRYNLASNLLKLEKGTASLVDASAAATIALETTQASLYHEGMSQLYSLLLGQEFPKQVVTTVGLGIAADAINERGDSVDQSHVPKHLRRSVLTQPMIDPEDPDKNKNNKDKKELPKGEQVLPQMQTYEQARNKALEIIGDVDPHTASPHIGTVGSGEGKITGLDWHGEDVTIRLDWDPKKGAHINVSDYRLGKGSKAIEVAIPFEGNLNTVEVLYGHLNTPASLRMACDKLKEIGSERKLALLQYYLAGK